MRLPARVSLTSVLGSWPANTVQALLFGFHHGGAKHGGIALLGRSAIGFVFGVIAMRTETITIVIALHYLADALLAATATVAEGA